jgi:GNAT superfamily N-acetyltransferase
MDYSMVEAREHGVLYVPDGERFGASVWSIPKDASTEVKATAEKHAFILRHLGRGSLDTYIAMTEFMSKQAEGLIPADAWYLSIIAVSPVAQGQGLGRKLLCDVLTDVDQAGVPTYLETFTPRSKSFYRRLGYRDVAVIQEPTTGAEYSVMLREPGCHDASKSSR